MIEFFLFGVLFDCQVRDRCAGGEGEDQEKGKRGTEGREGGREEKLEMGGGGEGRPLIFDGWR